MDTWIPVSLEKEESVILLFLSTLRGGFFVCISTLFPYTHPTIFSPISMSKNHIAMIGLAVM
jgi:hypothetical protein